MPRRMTFLFKRLIPLALAFAGMLCISCGDNDAFPLETRSCGLSVEISLPGIPAQVDLYTNHDDFTLAHPLTQGKDGIWRISLRPTPGPLLYHILVDDRSYTDPNNPLTAMENGKTYSLAEIESCDAPKFSHLQTSQTASGPQFVLQFLKRPKGSGLAPKSVTAHVVEAPQNKVDIVTDGPLLAVTPLDLPYGKYHLQLSATDKDGVETEPFEAPFWVENSAFKWEDALIYQIVVDRFAGDEDFEPTTFPEGTNDPYKIAARHGGNLRGIIRHIEDGYFEKLGVNTLWISPLNQNPTGLWGGTDGGSAVYESYHAYWPIAPRTVDKRFGTEADVENLVQTAHAHGIRVLMDIVLNHVHQEHPYYGRHPSWFNPDGCYCGWSDCPWYGNIEHCWFTNYLPDISWEKLETLTTQVDDALWWIERFNFDGLRVDAVPMMPRFVTRWLTSQVHSRFEGLYSRQYLVGECFTDASARDQIKWYLGPQGLDGLFDFPLMWNIRDAFAWQSTPLWSLYDGLKKSEKSYGGSTAVMSNFIGNHDVTRFISEADGHIDGSLTQAFAGEISEPTDVSKYAQLALAQVFLLTIPGAPTIYYGDEFGLPGANDPDNRRDMKFAPNLNEQESALFELVSKAGRLRQCLPALRRAPFSLLRAESERLAYYRDLGDGAPAIIALSRNPKDPSPMTLTLPENFAPKVTKFYEVFSGQVIGRKGNTLEPLGLPALTPAILIPADHRCTNTL